MVTDAFPLVETVLEVIQQVVGVSSDDHPVVLHGRTSVALRHGAT